MRFSLDTNVLVYAADNRDTGRQDAAIWLIGRAVRSDCILVPQALSEFFHAATRKRICHSSVAATLIRNWMTAFPVSSGADKDAIARALDAGLAGRFQFYDALLLATARGAGCAAVISEDMRDGAELDGVRVVAAFGRQGGIGPGALTLLAPAPP